MTALLYSDRHHCPQDPEKFESVRQAAYHAIFLIEYNLACPTKILDADGTVVWEYDGKPHGPWLQELERLAEAEAS